MNILNKIEKIQKQPEHIRLRWVWGMTLFSMFFIILLWLISLSAKNQNSTENSVMTEEQKVLLEEFGQQKKSITDTASDLKNTYEESIKNQNPTNSETQPEI